MLMILKVKSLIRTHCQKEKNLNQLNRTYLKLIPNLKKFSSRQKKTKTKWDKTLEKYNQLFVNEVFKVEITNESAAKLNLEMPKFTWKLKKLDLEMNNEVKTRLSNGEKENNLYFIIYV